MNMMCGTGTWEHKQLCRGEQREAGGLVCKAKELKCCAMQAQGNISIDAEVSSLRGLSSHASASDCCVLQAQEARASLQR